MPGPIIRFPDEGEEAQLREEATREIAAAIERDRQRRARWPQDLCQAMSALAELFPTLRGVPGTNPWNVDRFLAWMNSGAPTSGSWCAGLFLLGVWNRTTKWRDCGLKAKEGEDRFDMFRAMGCWDQKHIDAFQEWVKYPFWP
jgi:hypothetical protein